MSEIGALRLSLLWLMMAIGFSTDQPPWYFFLAQGIFMGWILTDIAIFWWRSRKEVKEFEEFVEKYERLIRAPKDAPEGDE